MLIYMLLVVDANLLLYATNRNSADHAAAKHWWESVLSGDESAGSVVWCIALASCLDCQTLSMR